MRWIGVHRRWRALVGRLIPAIALGVWLRRIHPRYGRALVDAVAAVRGSIRSSVQIGDVGDVDALFKDFINSTHGEHTETTGLLNYAEFPADDVNDDEFLTEFEPVGEIDEEVGNEGRILRFLKGDALNTSD